MTLWKASSVVLAPVGTLATVKGVNLAVAAKVTRVHLVSKRNYYMDKCEVRRLSSVKDLEGSESKPVV